MTDRPQSGKSQTGKPQPGDIVYGELTRLISRMCDGGASESELTRLEEILLNDRQSRKFYYEFVDVHGDLCWTLGKVGSAGQPVGAGSVKASPSGVTGPSEAASEASSATDSAAAKPRSPVLGFLGGVVDYVNHSRRLMFVLVAVMLCSWFVFQIGSVLVGRWWVGDPRVVEKGADPFGGPRSGRKSDGSLPGGAEQLHPKALAWLSGSVDARWQVVTASSAVGGPAAGNSAAAAHEGPDFWDIGTEFTAGQQITLVEGLGEITFHSGAKIILSAPVEFTVVSALRTDLHVGKLSARVPHVAAGFTVGTPSGNVVDLGTEFGVEVTADRKLDVQVFVGAVKVNTSSGVGSVVSADPGLKVSAGHTAHWEAGRPPSIFVSHENRFQRDLKIESDSNDKQMAAYLDMMRKLKPVVWLRMEGKETDRALHDEMGQVPAATLHWDGPGNPFVSGAVGKGLWLRGAQLRDYAALPDYPKAEQGRLSVSAWVYADSRPKWGIAVGNWREGSGGQFCLGLNRSDADHTGGDLDVGILDGSKSTLHVREGSQHLFPLHQWEHIAFTTDGATLRLYREGREVASEKHKGLINPAPIPQLGIGVEFNKTAEAPGESAPGFWDGKLDEIAVFNETLTAEQIEKLAAAPPR